MKRLLRRWKALLALLILLPVLLLGVAQWLASSQLSPESLVQRIESSLNCRAEVTSATASLFSFPAKLEIQGLKLAPRDADADAAKPLHDRTPLKIGDAGVAIEAASLEINLWSLLTGDLSVRDIVVQRLNFASSTNAAGVNSTRVMLEKPATVAGQPNPRVQKPAVAAPKSSPDSNVQKATTPPLTVADFPFVSSARSIRIEGIRVDARSEKRKELLRWDAGSFTVEDLAIHPTDLASGNHAKLQLGGRLQIIGKRKVYHADLGLAVLGDFAPFDPASGELAAIPFQVSIAKDSVLNEVPALQKISSKMKRWEKYGLKFADLPDSVKVLEDSRVSFSYHLGKLDVLSPLQVKMDHYTLELSKGGWLNVGDNQCSLEIRITGSPSVSEKTLLDFSTSLKGRAGEAMGATLYEKIASLFKKQNLILPDGRLSIPMGLTGDLGKPEVEDRVMPILEQGLIQSILPNLE